MKFSRKLRSLVVVGALAISSSAFSAPPGSSGCKLDISWSDFTAAVDLAFEQTNGVGFGLGMWATLMDTQGQVCAVYSVKNVGGDGPVAGAANGGPLAGNVAWLGSRVISAQKANTANAFSLDGLSIPTGAVSYAVYPGGSLYGLQHSNPVDATVAYAGNRNNFGTKSDPLVGNVPGGVNVFGGGIALYEGPTKVGAVGVSGDTSCRDAAMAYNLRRNLGKNPSGSDIAFDDVLYLVDTTGADLPSALYEQPGCGLANDPDDAGLYGVVYGSFD